MRRLLILFVLSLNAPSVTAQSAPEAQQAGRVTLRGVVVDAGDGAALPRARITVTWARTTVASVSTDQDGRFSVGVDSGALSIRIVKAGYASIELPVSPPELRASDPLRIEVPRGATIAGRAIDTSGQPGQVVVIRRETSDGTIWSPAAPDGLRVVRNIGTVTAIAPGGLLASENLATVAPDERGEYRIGGLPPGRYLIEAHPSGAAIMVNGSSGTQMVRAINLGSAVQVRPVTVDLQPGSQAVADLLIERPPSEVLQPDNGPDRPGSTIRGIVSTMEGAPLADATVWVARSGAGGAQIARTDAFGRFTIRGIAAGPVSVRATMRGYAESQPGQRGRALPGLPVTVEAGKDVDNLSIVLPRTGAIGGVVVNEHGEPLQEAAVLVLRVRREPTGALVGLRERSAPPIRRTTDDRGQFLVPDIVPGDYVLMASLPPETVDPAAVMRTAYVPAYYPDTSDFASASPIRLTDGEVIPGLTLTMRRAPVVRVAGVAHTATGTPFTGTVRLTPRNAAPPLPAERVVSPGPGGEFVFADVPPGDYVLRALVPSGPAGPELAAAPVTVVDRDPEPQMLRTSPGSSVVGRIVLEGGPGDVLWGYSATSAPLDSASSPVSTSNLGAPITTSEPFTLGALAGLMRLRVWSDDQNWYVKSILINGFDVVDTPFDFGFDGQTYSDVEVVFSRLGASIAGRATDDRAAPVHDYAVYVFSTDRDKWVAGSRWVKLTRATADGRFTVPSLPSGEYWVVAVDRADGLSGPADWVDTELLELLSARATRITLSEGQSQVLTLRVLNR